MALVDTSGGSSVSQNKLPQVILGYIYILKYLQSNFIGAQRWRVFQSRINLHPAKCEKLVKACCILHNYLQNSTVMLFRLIIMKASLISMKFIVCIILQMWDVELRTKHMFAEINLKHAFVLVKKKFHGNIQPFREAQQCKIRRFHNNLLLLEFDYNVLYRKWVNTMY